MAVFAKCNNSMTIKRSCMPKKEEKSVLDSSLLKPRHISDGLLCSSQLAAQFIAF